MPTIASSLKQSRPIGTDPRLRRFGFFPGLFIAEMESSVSGQQERIFPQGELIAFESADLEVSNFDIQKSNWTPTKNENITAEWFISNVKKTYGQQGFVELDVLTTVSDDEAKNLFALVHPSFSAVSHVCPQGLTKTCAACRIKLLEAQTFEDETADKLRMQLLYSYVTYHDHARNRWAETVSDFGKGLSTIGDGEEHYRKNVHEIALTERAVAAADAMGQRQAAATVEGMKEIGGGFREALTQLAANQEAAEKRHAEEMALMRQMLNQNSVNHSVTDAKVDKRTKEYKDAHKSESQAGD